MLTKEHIERYYACYKEQDDIHALLVKRVNEVYEVIANALNIKFPIFAGRPRICGLSDKSRATVFVAIQDESLEEVLDFGEYNFADGIPQNFLFMENYEIDRIVVSLKLERDKKKYAN